MEEKIDPQAIIEEAVQLAYKKFVVGDLQSKMGIPGSIEILEQVLRCDANQKDAIQLLGLCFHKIWENDKAIELFNKAIDLEPDNADNYNNRGLAFSCVGDHESSISDLKKAVELAPMKHQFRNNLALQYRQISNHELAISTIKEALEQSEDQDPVVWCNLGGIYGECHELIEAVNCFKNALKIDPKLASAHVDLAYSYHLMGEYEKAWQEYEYRFEYFPQLQFYNQCYDPNKRWKRPDQKLDNKTITIYSEQGYGDAIQFSSYIPYIKEKYQHVKIILHCQDLVEPLLSKQDRLKIDEFYTTPIIHSQRETLPDHDMHASLLSLPYLLGMPRPIFDQHITITEGSDLGFHDRFKVGLCWTGSPQHPNDRIRSCPLKLFRPLFDIPNVKIFSLVKDYRAHLYHDNKNAVDYMDGCEDIRITDLSEFMTDFYATARLIKDLDLVITVDTSILHLAGAMGTPTLGLLAYNPDWRWGIRGNKTDWYPSVKLVRQKERNNWDCVINKIKNIVEMSSHERNSD